jgi:hypothetical protein
MDNDRATTGPLIKSYKTIKQGWRCQFVWLSCRSITPTVARQKFESSVITTRPGWATRIFYMQIRIWWLHPILWSSQIHSRMCGDSSFQGAIIIILLREVSRDSNPRIQWGAKSIRPHLPYRLLFCWQKTMKHVHIHYFDRISTAKMGCKGKE